MSKCNRIYIIGHHGAGKGLLAKTLADKIGWKFIDADFGLEARVGLTTREILGQQGETNIQKCMSDILTTLNNQSNIVVTTDASIVCDEKNRQLLSSGFVVYVNVGLPVQMERIARHSLPLLNSNIDSLLERLHRERDDLYESVASVVVDSDNGALDKHVLKVIDALAITTAEAPNLTLHEKDYIIFHKTLRVPIRLPEQQARCVKLLAQGRSAKEIAYEMKISYRTVEGYIAKVAELLGCESSKELITLYLDQPGEW